MRNRLFKIGAGLAALTAVFISSAAAQPPAMKTLSGHVPAVVSRLQAKGLLPATNNLYLAIGLPLRNQEALTNLLRQIYDPASPNYHHYLTPEQFTAQFGPTEQDYQAVINFARASGLTVVGAHPNRMLLDVAGNAANVGRAFDVTLRIYHHPTENRDFFAPDTEPSVPSALPVQDISGLDNYPPAASELQSIRQCRQGGGGLRGCRPNATTGSGPAGNYIGNDFRNAYVPGTSLTVPARRLPLLSLTAIWPVTSVNMKVWRLTSSVPLQNVLLDGFGGLPTGTGGEVEVSLDIEMVISMAPGLSKVVLYEGNPYNFSLMMS